MTDTLDELEKLLKAGTKGPWETKQNKAGNTTIGPVGYSGFITPWVCDDENAALIVAAVNALPELLALREEVGRLREALTPATDDVIREIKARHETLASQMHLRSTGVLYQEGRAAHADRATLIERNRQRDAEVKELRSVLADLMSWFPEKPSPPEWCIKGGHLGADDAVAAARAALSETGAA